MGTKFYIDAFGPDKDALKQCIHKAFKLADADNEVNRVVLYSYTKENFSTVAEVLTENNVKKMLSQPIRFKECTKPVICLTERTYEKSSSYASSKKDVVICCHMNSDAIFKVEDCMSVKYIIALPWLKDDLNEWKARWHPQNLLNSQNEEEMNLVSNPILEIALREMDENMFNSKSLIHPNDEERCKTYIRAIHIYLPSVKPSEVKDFLVTNLDWKSSNAEKAGRLLQTLKEGRTFKGGRTTDLKKYYDDWVAKNV